MKKSISLLLAVLFLAACGGGSSSEKNEELSAEQEEEIVQSINEDLEAETQELDATANEALDEIDSLLNDIE